MKFLIKLAAIAAIAFAPPAGAERSTLGDLALGPVARADGSFQLASLTLTGAGSASTVVATLAGPWFDDGLTPTNTSLNGRVINGQTWIANAGAGTNQSAITTTQTANLPAFRGSQGSGPNGVFAYVSLPYSTSMQVTRRLGLLATAGWSSQADYLTPAACCTGGTDSWSYVENLDTTFGMGSMIPSAKLNGTASSNPTTISGATSAQFLSVTAGDVLQVRYTLSGGNLLGDTYYNGKKINSAQNYTASGVTLTNANFGFRGNIASSPNQYSFIQVGDLLTQGLISLEQPNKLAPLDSNGDLTFHFRGDYNLTAPAGVHYTIYDNSGSTPVAMASATNLPVLSFTASSGVWTGVSAKIPAANIPTSFYTKVCRDGITGGTPESCSFGPIQKPAQETMISSGQSLIQQLNSSYSPFVVPLGSLTSYTVGASWGTGGTYTSELLARVAPLTTGTAGAAQLYSMTSNIVRYYGATNGFTRMQYLIGGLGGQSAYTRSQAGSDNMVSMLRGIDFAGGDVTSGFVMDGTYDVGTTCPFSGQIACWTDYSTNQDRIWSAIEAKVGHTVPVTLMFTGATKGDQVSGANYDALHRQQYNMAQAGGRYCGGLATYHLAHQSGSGDPYHLPAAGYLEEGRLIAVAHANCRQGGTTFKRGLYLVSASETDDHTLSLVLDAPNAAGVKVNNTGVATYGFDQALQFGVWNGSALSTALGSLHATSFSCGAVAAGQVTCTAGFSGTPFAGSLHGAVTGPRGSNPINYGEDATIRDSGATAGDYWTDGGAVLMATYTPTAVVTAGTGGVSSTTLTVSAVTSGALAVGDWVNWGGSQSGLITALGTGTGGTGTYTLATAINVANGTTFTAAEPMVPVQHYFNASGASNGSQDYVTTP